MLDDDDAPNLGLAVGGFFFFLWTATFWRGYFEFRVLRHWLPWPLDWKQTKKKNTLWNVFDLCVIIVQIPLSQL